MKIEVQNGKKIKPGEAKPELLNFSLTCIKQQMHNIIQYSRMTYVICMCM